MTGSALGVLVVAINYTFSGISKQPAMYPFEQAPGIARVDTLGQTHTH
jgi:hypothetical protein